MPHNTLRTPFILADAQDEDAHARRFLDLCTGGGECFSIGADAEDERDSDGEAA